MSKWCLQVEALCEAAGVRLDVSSNRTLSASLEAACLAATDAASITLVKAVATRAMSEAEYCSTGQRSLQGMHCMTWTLQMQRACTANWRTCHG